MGSKSRRWTPVDEFVHDKVFVHYNNNKKQRKVQEVGVTADAKVPNGL